MTDPFYEGFRPDSRSTDELIKAALAASDWQQYKWHLQLLQYRGTEDVFQSALHLCDSDREEERVLGADILGQLGTPGRLHAEESVRILLPLLDDRCSDVVRAAAVSIGFHEARSAVEPLTKLADHPDPLVRKDVVLALSQPYYYEDELSIRTRAGLSSDPDRDVREEATASLTYVDPQRTDAGEALRRLLDDDDGEIRADALLGLACRHESDAVDLLMRELSRSVAQCAVWDDALDAASVLADGRLLPMLLRLKEIGIESCWLDSAIEACEGDTTSL